MSAEHRSNNPGSAAASGHTYSPDRVDPHAAAASGAALFDTPPSGSTHPKHPDVDAPPHYDDINTPVILLIGVIAALVTVLLIAFVEGVTYHWKSAVLHQRSYEAVDPAVVRVRAEQQNRLIAVDPEQNTMTIDQAIDQVVQQFQRNQNSGQPPAQPGANAQGDNAQGNADQP